MNTTQEISTHEISPDGMAHLIMYGVALMNLAEPPISEDLARIQLNTMTKTCELIGLYSKEEFLYTVAKERRFVNDLKTIRNNGGGNPR